MNPDEQDAGERSSTKLMEPEASFAEINLQNDNVQTYAFKPWTSIRSKVEGLWEEVDRLACALFAPSELFTEIAADVPPEKLVAVFNALLGKGHSSEDRQIVENTTSGPYILCALMSKWLVERVLSTSNALCFDQWARMAFPLSKKALPHVEAVLGEKGMNTTSVMHQAYDRYLSSADLAAAIPSHIRNISHAFVREIRHYVELEASPISIASLMPQIEGIVHRALEIELTLSPRKAEHEFRGF